MKVNNTPRNILLTAILDDRILNVRDVSDEDYDAEPMVADLVQNGQQEPIWALKRGEKFVVIKGFRRTNGFRIAAERGLTINDTLTGKPLVGPGVEPSIKVLVHENLTDSELADLMVDQGQRKGLSKAGLQRAMERLFPHKTEQQVAVTLYGQLAEHYPPKRQIIEEALAKLPPGTTDADKKKAIDKAKGDYFRGVIQNAKRIMMSPIVLHSAAMDKLRGKQPWPTNGDIKTLCDIHDTESKNDPTISRAKPGPLFTEKWEQLLAAVDKAKTAGERPKSVGMRSRQQTEDTRKGFESLILKVLLGVQLGELSADNLPVIDKIACEAEKVLTDEQRSTLIDIAKSGKSSEKKDDATN